MSEHDAPDETRRLADRRRAARAERNWSEADRLKAEIEAAGWRIVDQGRGYTLSRAHPPDIEEGDAVRYGWSGSVPSVLTEPPSARITLVRAVPDDAPSVGEAPDAAPGAGLQVVVVRTSRQHISRRQSGGHADERLAGHGRIAERGHPSSARRVVVLAAPDRQVTSVDLDRLADALDDPTVAVAGPGGWASEDLRRFDAAPAGDAVAIDGDLLAFRRADYLERGPLDEAFGDPFRLDVWWSLTLRDEGPDAPPRRALVLVGATAEEAGPEADDARPLLPEDPGQRRNFYRVIRQFGGARHLTGA